MEKGTGVYGIAFYTYPTWRIDAMKDELNCVTTKRGRNRNYLLMNGEKEVGEAWKNQGKPGFLVKLHGIYWCGGEPNRRGGSTATRVRRLMDAAPLAERAAGNAK